MLAVEAALPMCPAAAAVAATIDSVECVLHSAGRTFEDVPEEISALSAAAGRELPGRDGERDIKLARP